MALHLVGETIDPKQAHKRAQAGELTQLTRGVYVDADSDTDDKILAHAVRIARYLYPTAYLSGASSIQLAPTQDGRLFISGRRNQRTRLRSLEIVQNTAPAAPSTIQAVIADDLGEMRVPVSSPLQRFLEAFRLRSEQAAAIDDLMKRQTAVRLVLEFGSAQSVADAAWTLARTLGWLREGEGAERYLQRRDTGVAPANKAELNLTVAWHGEALGRLIHDGIEWRWLPRRGAPALVRQTVPGQLPALIESLLPEGWLKQVVQARDQRAALRGGRRYMSNITIGAKKDLEPLPLDILEGKLALFSRSGLFTGRYKGPGRREIDASFEEQLARLYADAETPRLSGVQIKAPMCLTTDGDLVPATGRAFTHILKPAGGAGFEMLAIAEWICLALGRAAGFETPSNALITMPDDLPPALLVERFDIRTAPDDPRRLAMEDFCSVLDVPADAKYDGTIERAARAMRPLSTNPDADVETLFRRALFAWLVADGDMHLKNLALLKIMSPGATRFDSVRMAPLYDAVTTRIFPNLAADRIALKLNGKDDRLTPNDFITTARTIGLTVATAETTMADIPRLVAQGLDVLTLPTSVATVAAAHALERIAAIVRTRIQPFAA
jgi:serine/threonine-protein kinase HipA